MERQPTAGFILGLEQDLTIQCPHVIWPPLGPNGQSQVCEILCRVFEQWGKQVVNNVGEVVLQWLRQRFRGRDWVLRNRDPRLDSRMYIPDTEPVFHALWFTGNPLPIVEQQAMADFYGWCLRPASLAHIWRSSIVYIERHRIMTFEDPIFACLREATRSMLRDVFEYVRQGSYLRRGPDMPLQGLWVTVGRNVLYQSHVHTNPLINGNLPAIGVLLPPFVVDRSTLEKVGYVTETGWVLSMDDEYRRPPALLNSNDFAGLE
jgi:hypothetical protein